MVTASDAPEVAPEFANVLERAVQHDEAAFAELWRRHHVPLVRYLGTSAPGHADDLASETWLQVARGLSRFDGDEGAFRAWLFTIARRRVIDHHRAVERRPKIDPVKVPEQAGPATEVIAAEHLATADALALIGQLPPAQAEVVLLRAIAGLSVEQVAEVVGKRPGTVRVIAHRGLQRLRDIVEGRPL